MSSTKLPAYSGVSGGGVTSGPTSNAWWLTPISRTFANSPYVIASTIGIVFYDTAGGNSVTQLPDATLAAQLGRTIVVVKVSLLNTLTVTSVAGNVQGNAPGVGFVIAAGALASYSFCSDGANWWISL